MEPNDNTKNSSQYSDEQNINFLGSFPPMIQFGALIIGVFLEFVFPTKFFPPHTSQIIGAVIVVIASLLILWSQKTSKKFRDTEKRGGVRNFQKGPYRYSDNPTSFSLSLLIIGFGFLANSLGIVILSAIGYWISFAVYEQKKQKIMADKYKEEYVDYKKKIKSLF